MTSLHWLYKQAFRVRVIDEGLHNCRRLQDWCSRLGTPNASKRADDCQETINKLHARRQKLVNELLETAEGDGVKPINVWGAIDRHFERFQQQRPQ